MSYIAFLLLLGVIGIASGGHQPLASVCQTNPEGCGMAAFLVGGGIFAMPIVMGIGMYLDSNYKIDTFTLASFLLSFSTLGISAAVFSENHQPYVPLLGAVIAGIFVAMSIIRFLYVNHNIRKL